MRRRGKSIPSASPREQPTEASQRMQTGSRLLKQQQMSQHFIHIAQNCDFSKVRFRNGNFLGVHQINHSLTLHSHPWAYRPYKPPTALSPRTPKYLCTGWLRRAQASATAASRSQDALAVRKPARRRVCLAPSLPRRAGCGRAGLRPLICSRARTLWARKPRLQIRSGSAPRTTQAINMLSMDDRTIRNTAKSGACSIRTKTVGELPTYASQNQDQVVTHNSLWG